MKKRGRPPKVKNGSIPSIISSDCVLNDIKAEINGKDTIKTTKKPTKLVKKPEVQNKHKKESESSKITAIGTVNHKKKKKVLPSNSHQQMKLDGNSKIVDAAVAKPKLPGLPKLKLKRKPQKTISKSVKKQKCYSIKNIAVFAKNKRKQTTMELSNSTIENQTVSDDYNSSNIEDRIKHEVELDQEQKSPIITSNPIKNKFEKLKMIKKSLVNDKESHQKERDSESCTTSNDQMTELYYRSLGLVPTNSIFSRKRKIVPEQKSQTNSNSVIPQPGNNFKIIVNVDTNKLPTDLEQPIQERHDSTDLKTVNRNSSYTDRHNEASEDEELQPVNKKIHVAHVENAIDDAEKTYGSVTDEIIQNSVAEKDKSAIKSPSSRVLQKRKVSDASCIEETINYVVKTYSTEPNDRLCMKQNSAIKHSYVHLENTVFNRDLQQTYNANKKAFRKKIKNKHRDVKKMNSNLLNSSVYSKTDMANPSNNISSTASSLPWARKLSQEIKNNNVNESNTFTLSKSLSSKPYSTKSLQSEPSTNTLSNYTSPSNSILCQQQTSLNEPDGSTANTRHLKINKRSVSSRSNSSNSSSNSSLNFSNFIDPLQEGTCRETADSSTSSPSLLDTSVNTHYQNTQFTTVADRSTSSSDSSAVLNTSTDGISSKNEKLTNMAGSSVNLCNAPNKQSETANTIESDVLIHNYNIVPAFLNIKITRNIAANSDDRIIQLIPQPRCSDLQENDCSSKPTVILDYRGYEEDETFDDEDNSCKNWPLFYNFTTEETIIRILSHDNIFEGAVLSSPSEHEITSSRTYTVINRLPISNKNIPIHVTQENDTAAECNSNRTEQFEMDSQFMTRRNVSEDGSSHRTSSIISADNETVVSQQNFKFKTPMLPPAKRPPTRLKSCTSDTSSRSRSPGVSELSFSTLSVSNNSDTSTVANQFAESLSIKSQNDSRFHNNDDAISLYAGTIKGSDVEDYLLSTENLKESEDNPLHIEDISSGNNVQFSPTPLIELPKQSVTLPQSDIIKWIASSEEAIKSNPKKSPPIVFKKLCYHHFARDGCKRGKCKKKHMLPEDVAEQIKNLSHKELVDAYNFTKDQYKLYAQTIYIFIKIFKERKCISNVISIVNDIMNIKMFDRTPLINEIIKALQAMNMSFYVAVEFIVAQQATDIVLSDILLFIICVQHKDELTKNWNLVRKLIQYRNRHYIDHHLLEDIITECCYNKNKDLCKNVMKDIISQDLVDLQIVSINKINDFLSVLRSLELEGEERLLIDVMKKFNIIIHKLTENRLTTRNDLHYRNVSTEQLLQNERVISNEYNSNKNMRNSCSVDENVQQFSGCQKSDDTRVHKDPDIKTLTTSNTQYMCSKHDGNISNAETDSKDYCDTTWSKNVKLANSSSPALQFDMDEFQGKRISRDLNLVSQNIEIESSTASDNYIKSNFCEDLSLTQNDIFGIDREMSYQSNLPGELDFAKNLNVVSGRSSLMSHHSNSSSIINRDVTNNMGMQYVRESEISSTSSSDTSPIASFHCDDMCDSTETSLDDRQVKMLLEIIATEFILVEFLAMFNTYKDTPLKESFIVNTIGVFKRKTPLEIYNMSVQILTGLQQQGSAYMNDENTESMLYMLIVNVVALLDRERSFDKAAQLLVKFYTNLKCLTQTKWLRSIQKYSYSEVGKYLNFCRIFVKGGYLKEAVDILMAPDLRLLYGSNMWPLECNENFDIELRNCVLQDVIEVALKINIPIAKRVILQLITDKEHITEIDIWRPFNSLILNMLNSNDTYMDDLKEILPNVLQGWYRHLTNPVMRGLLVKLVVSDVPSSELIKLYKKCSKQKIYQPIKGTEEKLVLRTDMKHEEIYMTVHYLFTKIAKCNYPLHEIIFSIKLSDSISSHPKILFNSDVNVSSLKARVYNVLACSFNYAIHVQNNENEPYIRISPDDIRRSIDYYKKTAGTPNSSSYWVRQSSVEQMQKET